MSWERERKKLIACSKRVKVSVGSLPLLCMQKKTDTELQWLSTNDVYISRHLASFISIPMFHALRATNPICLSHNTVCPFLASLFCSLLACLAAKNIGNEGQRYNHNNNIITSSYLQFFFCALFEIFILTVFSFLIFLSRFLIFFFIRFIVLFLRLCVCCVCVCVCVLIFL